MLLRAVRALKWRPVAGRCLVVTGALPAPVRPLTTGDLVAPGLAFPALAGGTGRVSQGAGAAAGRLLRGVFGRAKVALRTLPLRWARQGRSLHRLVGLDANGVVPRRELGRREVADLRFGAAGLAGLREQDLKLHAMHDEAPGQDGEELTLVVVLDAKEIMSLLLNTPTERHAARP